MPLIIKSDGLVNIANRLDRMHKSDLPIAVRSTLNSLAFQMKKEEIGRSAKQEFDYKRTNIVNNLSRFSKAEGFNISRMRSKAGITEQPGRQKIARGLAAQEMGGDLESNSIPTIASRGGNVGAKVRNANKLQAKRMVNASRKKGSRFIAAAAIAKKQNSFILVRTNSTSKQAVARVSRFTRKKKGNPNIKLRWMYSIDDNKSIPASKTRKFVKGAYEKTMGNFGQEFKKQAERRLKK